MSSNDEKIKALSAGESEKLLGKETFRKRVNEIITEHVGSVEFMKKVREYAGMEIDSRMFRSFQYWLTLILTSVVTSVIAVIIALALGK